MDRREVLSLIGLSAVALSPMSPTFAAGAQVPAVLKPPRLKPGNTIGLVSPSGITRSEDKISIIRETVSALGLKLKVDEHALDRWGYLAGQDADRAEAINNMYADPEVHAVLPFIGGWGCARILPLLDYKTISKYPKIIMGFSDITALLVAIYAKTGLVTFHGPSGRSGWNAYSVDYVKRILFEGEKVSFSNPHEVGDNLTQVRDRTQVITSGKATGRLVGGNLTVISALMGSSYLPNWEGHILFLEDVGEGIYRIDRMLTQLKLAGVLDQISGFVFGKCTDCDADSGYSSFTLEEVLEDHIKPLGIPAYGGAMIGHISKKFTIPIGIEAEMDADAGTITLTESAVS